MASSPVDVYINVISGVGRGEVVHTHTFQVVGLRDAGDRLATDTLRLAIDKVLQWFIGSYMKLRFTAYAKEQLGYSVLPSTWAKKKRESRKFSDAILPNVFSGSTRTNALKSSVRTNAVGGATKGTIRGEIITADVPKGRNMETNRCLKTITPSEAVRISSLFEQTVRALVNSYRTTTVTTRNGKIRSRTYLPQEDAVQISRSMRGSRAATVSIT